MLEIIDSILLQKNIFSNKNNNFFYESDSYKAIFNKLNRCLFNREITFENVFTEEKKDKDESVVYTNFVINNLLGILNKKDTSVNCNKLNFVQDDKIQKKIDDYNNILLKNINFLKTKDHKVEKIKKKIETLQAELSLNKIIKNKNQLYQINECNNENIIKNFHLKKLDNKFFQKTKNILDANEKNEKKIIFFKEMKNCKHYFTLSKNVNKINDLILEKHSLKTINTKDLIKSPIEPLILNNSKNSIEWKKIISQKILLSIFNKKNQAEIHLKPENLGSIHITINMKNNEAKLNFISNNNEVRTLLNNYKIFLYDSLMKNGIKLKKFNICGSLIKKELKNSNDLFCKNIFNLNRFKKIFNIYEKKLENIKHKAIDLYV